MGLVVAATHLQLEQPVALKVFRGDLSKQNEPLLRFMREARAAAQLRSEHVGRVLDVGVTEDGTPFMVMEFLEGKSLDEVLAARGPLSIVNATEYAIQACEGLAEAHARGIVHRDIKPSNLFLVERSPGWGTIKILDFGISKVSLAQASNITTTLNMGTPCYMSPEQLRSAASVDHRTDIWSLGSTVFELLAGRPPFDPAQPLLSLALDIVTKEPPPVRQLRPEVPEALSAIVARCMAKDREDRFATAAELAMALIPFADARARVFAERALSLTPAAGLPTLEPLDTGNRSTPPSVKVPTAELWKIKSTGVANAAKPAPAPLPTPTQPARTAIAPQPSTSGGAPMSDNAPPLFPAPTAAADDGSSIALIRRWPWRKIALVAAPALLIVNVLLALARLHADRPPAARAAVAQTTAPRAVTAPPPAARVADPPPLNELVVRVSPPTARLAIDGAFVHGNPFRGQYRRGEVHEVRAFATGYKPKAQEIALTGDVIIDLSLDRDQTPPLLARIPPGLRASPTHRPTPAATTVAAEGGAQQAPAPRPIAAAMPRSVAARDNTVNPAGGRAPTHPIQTSSPYDTP